MGDPRRAPADRRAGIDVVVTSTPVESGAVIGRVLSKRVAWLNDLRDPWTFESLRPEFPTAPQRALDARMERWALGGADAVTAVQHASADDLRERLGLPAVRIPNGWDPEVVPAPGPPAIAVEPGTFRIVHTGMLGGSWGRDPGPSSPRWPRRPRAPGAAARPLRPADPGGGAPARDCGPSRRPRPRGPAPARRRADPAALGRPARGDRVAPHLRGARQGARVPRRRRADPPCSARARIRRGSSARRARGSPSRQTTPKRSPPHSGRRWTARSRRRAIRRGSSPTPTRPRRSPWRASSRRRRWGRLPEACADPALDGHRHGQRDQRRHEPLRAAQRASPF